MKLYLLFILVGVLFFLGSNSCKNPAPKINVEHGVSAEENGVVDILKYKVKQENFQENTYGINFEHIYFTKKAEHSYKLNINVDNSAAAENYHENYYVILSIYPFEDEIGLLATERQKYGFEMFSAEIRKNTSGALTISRMINTKINFARAVTLSVVEYKSKIKSMEVVMQNVKF